MEKLRSFQFFGVKIGKKAKFFYANMPSYTPSQSNCGMKPSVAEDVS